MTNVTRKLKVNAWKGECLELAFCAIKKKKWNSIVASLELMTQVGQLLSIFCDDTEIEEQNRKFNDVSDELSDVLLSLLYIANEEDVVLENLDCYEDFTYEKIEQLPVLLGQLSEALMEKYDYRFSKKHACFESVDDFIADRILRMIKILFNYADSNQIDLVDSFDSMCMEALTFVVNKSQGRKIKEIPVTLPFGGGKNYGTVECVR